jgi:pyruvate,orthophosphate dikinase
MQREDFEGIFEAMRGCPVIVRLLDPPLHEFLPDEYEVWKQVVSKRVTSLARYLLGQETPDDVAKLERLLSRVQELHENNPMLGLRAVRLSIMLPQIVEMQVRAIIEAAANVELTGTHVQPEIMIPLVGHLNELNTIQPRLKRVARAVMDEKGVELAYKFGTMIEIPRAAITGAEIAEAAEFFSFGTNDLTQMTYGFSRDDAERNFLLKYVEDGILPSNPFQTIDRDGVGQLMRMCVESGRHTRPDLEVGICGEHGGDADSIDFCHLIGMDYVSCSPFRIPVARLAAAHAALRHKPAN